MNIRDWRTMRTDITERTGNKRSGVWCLVRWQIRSHFFGDLGKEWVLPALLSLGASNLCEVVEAGRCESLRLACILGSESRQGGLSGSVWQDLCWARVLREKKKTWSNAKAVFVNLSKALKGKSSSPKQWTAGVQVIPTVSFPVEKGQLMCYQTRGSQLMPEIRSCHLSSISQLEEPN